MRQDRQAEYTFEVGRLLSHCCHYRRTTAPPVILPRHLFITTEIKWTNEKNVLLKRRTVLALVFFVKQACTEGSISTVFLLSSNKYRRAWWDVTQRYQRFAFGGMIFRGGELYRYGSRASILSVFVSRVLQFKVDTTLSLYIITAMAIRHSWTRERAREKSTYIISHSIVDQLPRPLGQQQHNLPGL